MVGVQRAQSKGEHAGHDVWCPMMRAYSVAGVAAALSADDDVATVSKSVNELALALIAPLGAEHADDLAVAFA